MGKWSVGLCLTFLLLAHLLSPLSTDMSTAEGHEFAPVPAATSPSESGIELTTIDVGGSHACAVLTDGSISCWGTNLEGQLGIDVLPVLEGRRDDNRSVDGIGFSSQPVQVVGLPEDDPMVQVVVGDWTSCGLTALGKAYCWGKGGYVGDSTTDDRPAPVKISIDARILKLAAGWYHTCALTVDGEVLCWGVDRGLGDGVERTDWEKAITPNLTGAFPSGRHAVDLAASSSGTCALLDNQSISCWTRDETPRDGEVFGGNASIINIQSGNHKICASLTNQSTACSSPTWWKRPTSWNHRVEWYNASVTAVTNGYEHTCLILLNGSVMCRGLNEDGQLGDGTWSDRDEFTPVQGLPSNVPVVAINAGSHNTCAVVATGNVHCWGQHRGVVADGTHVVDYYAEPVKFDVHPALTNITAIAEENFSYCIIVESGDVACWGHNYYGEIGDGTKEPRYHDVYVHDADDFGGKAIQVRMGFDTTCVVIDDGSVWCWGHNQPTKMHDFGSNRPVISMVQYYGGICVVEATGHVACWGDGTYGTIGNNRYDSAENPTRAFYFGPDKKAVKVESSQRSVCAQTEAGEVWCWGQNTYGMLGVGSDEWAENTPIKVEFPDDQLHAVDLVGAGEGYCAHLSDGSVHCWGGNYYGLLARGTNTETSNVPVLVFDQNRGVSQIGGTTPGMCAVLSNNTMWCWSEGLYGWDDPVDAPAQKWSNALLGKADAVLSGWGIATCLLAHEDGMWCYGDHQFVDADFNRTLPTPLIAFPGGETVLLPNQDTDEDGIFDVLDNCPTVSNPQQLDLDEDGVGDACDDDRDGDDVANDDDVCPDTADPQQLDLDADGAGDACDEDDDNDGMRDTIDDCPNHHAVIDSNCNNVPDVEEDVDGDGVPNDNDICEGFDDADDLDNDRIPDGCDDSDFDGVVDAYDICPGHDDVMDDDGDGVPNGCEIIEEPPAPEENETSQETELNETNVESQEDSASSSGTLTVAAVLGLLVLLAAGGMLVIRRRPKATTSEPVELNIALVEAYVQQLVQQGYPEDISRAHAIAHYSNQDHASK